MLWLRREGERIRLSIQRETVCGEESVMLTAEQADELAENLKRLAGEIEVSEQDSKNTRRKIAKC